MDYSYLKLVHMSCALVNYLLFFLRGVWRITESPILHRRWVKIVPHINDTFLLLTALAMAVTVARSPGTHAFLVTKLAGLVVYIVLGNYAFRWSNTRIGQISGWIAAQAVFLYIVAVAITKSPRLIF